MTRSPVPTKRTAALLRRQPGERSGDGNQRSGRTERHARRRLRGDPVPGVRPSGLPERLRVAVHCRSGVSGWGSTSSWLTCPKTYYARPTRSRPNRQPSTLPRDQTMNPGHGNLCRECRMFNQAAWERGHPSPCRLFGWSGAVHYSPPLSEDGRQCEDYRQRGRKPCPRNHGSRTKSAERCHEADAQGRDNRNSDATRCPLQAIDS